MSIVSKIPFAGNGIYQWDCDRIFDFHIENVSNIPYAKIYSIEYSLHETEGGGGRFCAEDIRVGNFRSF